MRHANLQAFNAENTAFVALLKGYAKRKDLSTGIRVHSDLLKRGLLDKSSHLHDALIGMYAKCGALAKAQDLLVGLPVRDVYSWTQVMMGYAQKGQGH
eukprot:c24122_g14_i1 orf=151-444(+)